MTIRDLSDAELAAITGMQDGMLDPLADLLEAERDGRHEILHPILHAYLLKMIRGSSAESDYRIVVKMHPDLKDKRHGRRAMKRSELDAMGVAAELAKHAQIVDGKWKFRPNQKTAIDAVIDKTRLSRATILEKWKEHKGFLLRWAMTAEAAEDVD